MLSEEGLEWLEESDLMREALPSSKRTTAGYCSVLRCSWTLSIVLSSSRRDIAVSCHANIDRALSSSVTRRLGNQKKM